MQSAENTLAPPDINIGAANQRKRIRLFKTVGLIVAVIGLIFYGYWLLVASKHVTTNNAYTAANIAQVTSSISGTVKTIRVVDTQAVKAGEVLVTLDDVDANLIQKQAEVALKRNQSDLERIQLNYNRRKKLAAKGFLPVEELNNAETLLKDAQASVDLAKVALDQARIDVSRTIMTAPIDGIVAKREVQLGQRIASGTYLLSIIPVSEIYVNANFKEGQLTKVKIGQRVELHADIYGSAVTYYGRVAGISGGTGSSFSVIPAQNATGNWIKVVQRVPVRIEIDRTNLAKYPLQVGLSMNVDINVGTRHA